MQTILLALVLRGLKLVVRPKRGRVLVLPNTGAGSIGDQAMMDVAVTELAARGAEPAVLDIPGQRYHTRIPYRAALLTGGKPMQLARTLIAMARAEGMAFIAADVINDKYHGTRRRLDLLSAAARAGMDVALFGFSLTDRPGPVSVGQLTAMPETVHAFLRDRLSHERYRRLTGRDAPLVADIAFLLRPEVTSPAARTAMEAIEGWRAEGAEVLAVNAGGPTLVAMGEDGVGAYVRLLSGWLGADPARRLLLVPHDFKPKPHGDLAYVEEIEAGLAPEFGDRIHMLRPPFCAWDVKALGGAVDVVLTARMHFAIACLGMGVPPFCVAYLGKFEGLMDHFGLADMLVEPEELPETDAMLARLEGFAARAPALRAEIGAALPRIKALSRQNFDWAAPPRT